MDFSPVDAASWTGLGVAATLVCAFVANRMGFLQIGIMRESHQLATVKAAPRIGCDIRVEDVQILSQGYRPHLRVWVKIYNDGELPATDIKGQWKFLPTDISKKRVFEIQRDFLGNCESEPGSHLIDDSANWGRDRIHFDVEVEFFYTVPLEKGFHRYEATARYDSTTNQMFKISYRDSTHSSPMNSN